MSIERRNVFARFVNDLKTLSKCVDMQNAAIVTDGNLSQVLSIGINGGPKGLEDCLCHTAEKYGCVHAEMNALIKCMSAEPGKAMFVTTSPCKQCAGAIINFPGGFEVVYYIKQWKNTLGLELLERAGIRTVWIGDEVI